MLQIINRPFSFDTPVKVDTDIKDVKTAVDGVIKVLTQKVYRLPSTHAIRAYQILVNHLELHYQDPKEIFRDVFTIRYLVRIDFVIHMFFYKNAKNLHIISYLCSETKSRLYK